MTTEPDVPADYDVLVIGAGPAGEKGAKAAAQFGKRVAIIEKGHDVGGAVANTGTLPSKTLRETAIALAGLKARKLYGVDLSLRREATVADFMFHEKQVATAERGRILANIGASRIEIIFGMAKFVDPHCLEVATLAGERRLLRGETILIATGSSPLRPPEFPFDDERVCDSDEILCLTHLPKSMAVVGAGVIGSEYACTFAALGCRVHLIDGRDQILPFLDREVAHTLTMAMQKLGITFHWKRRVLACDAPAGPVDVRLTLSEGESLEVDCVLVAAGRSSNTEDLNLAAAGITPGKRGLLLVDSHYCTNIPHIYAVGDVIGFPALAATSMEQARVAMCHACGCGAKKESLSTLLPTGVYTIPEVSMVGETVETATENGLNFVIGKAYYCDNARGQIIGDQDGFLKLLIGTKDHRVLGVHAIGEHATELVHIGQMAMMLQADVEIFNEACFNYPTLADLYKIAAYDAMAQLGLF